LTIVFLCILRILIFVGEFEKPDTKMFIWQRLKLFICTAASQLIRAA